MTWVRDLNLIRLFEFYLAVIFLLSTAALSILGYEHNDRDEPALCLWNDDHHVHP